MDDMVMSVEEEIARYVDHLRKTYEEALWDTTTQRTFQRSLIGKLDSLVKSGRIASHNLTNINFAKKRFQFSISHTDGTTTKSNFALDINRYHGKTSPND